MSQSPSSTITSHFPPSNVEDDRPQECSATSDFARQERLAALERRLNRSATEIASSTQQEQESQAFYANHDKRTEFRRLVDPGIMRPNSKEVALRSLRTLSMIAENLLCEPDNPKFRRFKPTNSIIKRDLINPKGALEYAVAMGFHPEVDHFQPYYTFKDKYMTELGIGAAILREAIQTAGKEEDEGLKVMKAKAEEEDRIKRAKEAFLDDRKAQMIRTERERSRRSQEERKLPTP
ncbi:hypothetical protein F5148DRAFT_280415 [Russula earlei]|uniref:Uncharacterized protein n=1 Tax=Russula earlei TaxID=71964 RepID=A0ACC0UNM6_9AGAM|nr:hypothetical protein F5148DRAFT_280415 [Russula earlei]